MISDSDQPSDSSDGAAVAEWVDRYAERAPTEHLRYIYSEDMFMAEAKGLTHWFIVYDGEMLYGWNIVRDVCFSLLEFPGLQAMAVDSVKGYLFVTDGSTVQRWPLVVELGADKMSPSIKLGRHYHTQYSDTETITALAVDADQSALYVATHSIQVVLYGDDASDFTLYEGQAAESMAVNLKGDLFLTTGNSIMRGKADDTGQLYVESEYFDSYASLFYNENQLYFTAQESNQRQGVYMKPVAHDAQPSDVIVEVASQTDKVTALGAFDSYVYFADSTSLFAVEAYQNGTYSEPRFFGIDRVPQVTHFVTFELRALHNLVFSAALLALGLASGLV